MLPHTDTFYKEINNVLMHMDSRQCVIQSACRCILFFFVSWVVLQCVPDCVYTLEVWTILDHKMCRDAGAQVVEWLESCHIRSWPRFDSGWRSFAACHIPLSLPYFLSVYCLIKVSMPEKIFKRKKKMCHDADVEDSGWMQIQSIIESLQLMRNVDRLSSVWQWS